MSWTPSKISRAKNKNIAGYILAKMLKIKDEEKNLKAWVEKDILCTEWQQ